MVVATSVYGGLDRSRELGLSGYDPLSPAGANINLVIPNTHIAAITTLVPHRSRMCRVSSYREIEKAYNALAAEFSPAAA